MPCRAPSRPSSLAIASLLLAGPAAVRAAAVPLIVEPPSGSLSGGFEVRIAGIGPVAGVTGVLFGDAPSAGVRILDALTLAATVNLSVGSRARSDGKDSISMMVDAATATGLTVVASGRNSGALGAGFGAPGAADRAITVSAIDDRRTVATADDAALAESNFGPRLTRLEPDGSGAVAFTVGSGPRGISIAGDGSIWVSLLDGGADRRARVRRDVPVRAITRSGCAPDHSTETSRIWRSGWRHWLWSSSGKHGEKRSGWKGRGPRSKTKPTSGGVPALVGLRRTAAAALPLRRGRKMDLLRARG